MRVDATLLLVTLEGLIASWQDATPDAPGLMAMRAVVRVAIGLLIVVLLSYIIVEQVGSRRRRRAGRE